MDWVSNFFLVCFLFGLIFTIASFLLGGLSHFDGIGHAGHGALDHGGHIASHGAGGEGGHGANSARTVTGFGWFNVNALIVFLTWFGGAGFVLNALAFNGWLIIPLALAAGMVGYLAVIFFLNKVLYSSQTPLMQDKDYDLTGNVARVSSPIFANGTGEVIFTKYGTRRSCPARSVDGRPFSRDVEVVILRMEHGVAYVEDLDKLLSDER